MQILEGIFYTNLTEDLSLFIKEIKQKEIIDEYTVFVLFINNLPDINPKYRITYDKYIKSHDCIILKIDEYYKNIHCSNRKYMNVKYFNIDYFKKYCSIYDLLEPYIKFTPFTHSAYILSNKLAFYIDANKSKIVFNNIEFSITNFIEEISTNYPECYKYDYSQIKPVITNNSHLCE